MKILLQKNCGCYRFVYSRGYYDFVHNGLQMCTKDTQNICQFYSATRGELFFFVVENVYFQKIYSFQDFVVFFHPFSIK